MVRFGSRWQILVLAACGLLFQPDVASPDAKDKFLEYINGKRLRNVLVLGQYATREDAEAFLRNGAINPFNGERFDAVFASGMSGQSFTVHVWEGARVVADNLSWSIQSNYEQLRGLRIHNFVIYSNGSDQASNAIKAGYIKPTHVYALAPPAGFKDEARHLPVETVHIRWIKGDGVAELLGKATVLKPLQKVGDVDVGVSAQPGADGTKFPMLGATVRGPLPGEPKGPVIDELIYEGPGYPFPRKGRVYLSKGAYQDLLRQNPGARATLESHARAFTDHLTDKGYSIDLGLLSSHDRKALGPVYKILEQKQSGPHTYRNIANNVALEQIGRAERSQSSDAEIRAVKARAPEAAAMVDVPDYWTWEGGGKSRGQTLTEARAMTGLVPDRQHVVVVGRSEAADLMEHIMVKRLGAANVKRLRDDPGPEALKREARAMGLGTAILGIREPDGEAPADRFRRRGAAGAGNRPSSERARAVAPSTAGPQSSGKDIGGGARGTGLAAGEVSPQSLGGIDFRRLPVRYIALMAPAGGGVSLSALSSSCQGTDGKRDGDAANASVAAFAVGVQTDASKFWVNLHPSEPERIIDPALERTEAGKILLISDRQLKKDGALITDPRISEAGREYWRRLTAAFRDSGEVRHNNRVFIVPDRVVVARGERDAYIVEARMRVELETSYLQGPASKRPTNGSAHEAEVISRDIVARRLSAMVNDAPQYSELRQVFHGLILARFAREFVYAGRREATSQCGSGARWDKRAIWADYVRSVRQGEYHFTEESRRERPGGIEVTRTTYFNGGVDFTRLAQVVRYTAQLDDDARRRITQSAQVAGWTTANTGVYLAGVPAGLGPSQNAAK